MKSTKEFAKKVVRDNRIKTYFYPGDAEYYMGTVLDIAILLNGYVVIRNPTQEHITKYGELRCNKLGIEKTGDNIKEEGENRFFELVKKGNIVPVMLSKDAGIMAADEKLQAELNIVFDPEENLFHKKIADSKYILDEDLFEINTPSYDGAMEIWKDYANNDAGDPEFKEIINKKGFLDASLEKIKSNRTKHDPEKIMSNRMNLDVLYSEALNSGEGGNASITIRNPRLDIWEYKIEKLRRQHQSNLSDITTMRQYSSIEKIFERFKMPAKLSIDETVAFRKDKAFKNIVNIMSQSYKQSKTEVEIIGTIRDEFDEARKKFDELTASISHMAVPVTVFGGVVCGLDLNTIFSIAAAQQLTHPFIKNGVGRVMRMYKGHPYWMLNRYNIEAVQQFKNGVKGKIKGYLNPKQSKIFSTKSNYGAASISYKCLSAKGNVTYLVYGT